MHRVIVRRQDYFYILLALNNEQMVTQTAGSLWVTVWLTDEQLKTVQDKGFSVIVER